MAELTLEESVRQILPTLPLPIQRFFEERKLGETARTLMERYALHVDHGAVLERELMLVLLGLEGPDEFAEALYTELPISKQTVQDILSDLNKEVFVPIRDEMQKGMGTQQATKSGVQGAVTTPNYFPVAPPPGYPKDKAPVYPAPQAPGQNFDVVPPPSGAPAAVPARPSSPNIAPLPPKLVMPSAPTPRPKREIVLPQMLKSNEPPAIILDTPKTHERVNLLADHEEAHIAFHKSAQPQLQPQQPVRPSKNILTQNNPSVVQPWQRRSPSVGLPFNAISGAAPTSAAPMPRPPVQSAMPPPPPTSPTMSQGVTTPPTLPSPKQYNVDPYHEPVE